MQEITVNIVIIVIKYLQINQISAVVDMPLNELNLRLDTNSLYQLIGLESNVSEFLFFKLATTIENQSFDVNFSPIILIVKDWAYLMRVLTFEAFLLFWNRNNYLKPYNYLYWIGIFET